jgi:hypothetical protein
VNESLVRAFPARLAPVVTGIVASLPEARLPPAGSVTESNTRSWPGLVVAGEPVVIPHRIYNPSPSFWRPLGHLEKLVVAGIYSRHHDGFVRQRWLSMLLDADEPWVAPFIVQLLGEYVIEICYDIARFALSGLPGHSALHRHLSAFLRDNPCFAELTRQRAISYWNCYYRYRHLSQDMYPALVALSVLSGGGTTWHLTSDRPEPDRSLTATPGYLEWIATEAAGKETHWAGPCAYCGSPGGVCVPRIPPRRSYSARAASRLSGPFGPPRTTSLS